jgi:hypothetical protein
MPWLALKVLTAVLSLSLSHCLCHHLYQQPPYRLVCQPRPADTMLVLLTDILCFVLFPLLIQPCQVLPSGYIGTSPAAVEEISAKSLSTGMYTFYQV